MPGGGGYGETLRHEPPVDLGPLPPFPALPGATPVEPIPAVVPPRKRRGGLIVVLALLLVVFGAAGAVAFVQRDAIRARLPFLRGSEAPETPSSPEAPLPSSASAAVP